MTFSKTFNHHRPMVEQVAVNHEGSNNRYLPCRLGDILWLRHLGRPARGSKGAKNALRHGKQSIEAINSCLHSHSKKANTQVKCHSKMRNDFIGPFSSMGKPNK